MRRGCRIAVGVCLSVVALPLVLLGRFRRPRGLKSALVLVVTAGLVAPPSGRRGRGRGRIEIPGAVGLPVPAVADRPAGPAAAEPAAAEPARVASEPGPATAVSGPPAAEREPRTHPHPRPRPWSVSELSDHTFPEAYLALVSMVQGLAVAFLADRLMTGRVAGAAQAVGYVICTMMIIAVWQDYLAGSTICRWFPSLLDASIPAALGLAECFLIVSVPRGPRAFLSHLGLFLAVGTIAYCNWLVRARRHHDEPGRRKAYEFLRPYILFGCLACPTVSAAAFALAAVGNPADGLVEMIVALVLVTPMFLQSIVNWTLRRHLWQQVEDRPGGRHRR